MASTYAKFIIIHSHRNSQDIYGVKAPNDFNLRALPKDSDAFTELCEQLDIDYNDFFDRIEAYPVPTEFPKIKIKQDGR